MVISSASRNGPSYTKGFAVSSGVQAANSKHIGINRHFSKDATRQLMFFIKQRRLAFRQPSIIYFNSAYSFPLVLSTTDSPTQQEMDLVSPSFQFNSNNSVTEGNWLRAEFIFCWLPDFAYIS